MSTPTPLPRYEPVTAEGALRYGIPEGDYRRIIKLLDRSPNQLECGLLSYLWSDEIAARSGRTFLRAVFRQAPHVVALRSPSSGAIDLGFKEILAVTARSAHRYSSGDPYTGAITLVCSSFEEYIAFTGSLPQSLSSSVQVGESESARAQRFLQRSSKGLVEGANRCGIPIIQQDLISLPGHEQFSTITAILAGTTKTALLPAGTLRQDSLTARLKGNESLLYIGKDTPLPSAERSAFAYSPPPAVSLSVQLGQLIAEQTREGMITEIQPVNRGGLLYAFVSLAGRLEAGLSINYDAIPFTGPTPPPELGLAIHSPHRFLAVVPSQHMRAVSESVLRAGFAVTPVGNFLGERSLQINAQNRTHFSVPLSLLFVDQSEQNYELLAYPPMLHRGSNPDKSGDPTESAPLTAPHRTGGHELVPEDVLSAISSNQTTSSKAPWEDVWLDFLANPAISSRKALSVQADPFIGGTRLTDDLQGSDSFVLESESSFIGNRPYRGIVTALRTYPTLTALDPYLGAAHAAADALRTIACSGGHPVAATQSLIFGDPTQYKRLSEFAEAIRGLSDSCKIWGIPIIAESSDFQPQRQAPSVPPTITVTMFGVQPDIRARVPRSFQNRNDRILVLGETSSDLSSTEYRRYILEQAELPCPDINFHEEIRLATLLPELAMRNLTRSAISVGVGGLSIALSNACLDRKRPIGARLEIEAPSLEAALFSETAGRAVISCAPEDEEEIVSLCETIGVTISGKGTVGGREIFVRVQNQLAEEVEIAVSTAHQIWSRAIDHMLLASA